MHCKDSKKYNTIKQTVKTNKHPKKGKQIDESSEDYRAGYGRNDGPTVIVDL